MRLLVVESDDPKDAFAPALAQAHGAHVIPADEVQASCQNGSLDVLVVRDTEQAKQLARRYPALSIVVATSSPLAADELLTLLRHDVADVWDVQQSQPTTRQLLEALDRRVSATRADLRRRVSVYESELKRDQKAGQYVQMGMLPPSPMMIGDYRLQHRVLPSNLLSGDFVDYFALAGRYMAGYVADVSGHGASSAFVTVLLKNFSRRIRREYHPDMLEDPGQILTWLNRELLEQGIDKHVSLIFFVADVDARVFKLVNAGHFPPAILVDDSGARFVGEAGKPVGLFPSVSFTVCSLRVDENQRLVVYSDGMLEMLDESSLERKEQCLLDAASAAEDVNGLWQSCGVDAEAQGPDDISTLIVSCEP